jgi:uncharacterized membrane protein YsdA (DUF1294 family)
MVKKYSFLTLVPSVMITFLIWWLFKIDFLVSWLIVINFSAFLTYGYDKSIAGTPKTRIPEKVLLLLAILGGSLGALLGMYVFHHKTSKQPFLIRFWLIMGIQIFLIVMYFMFLKPK